MTYYYKLKSTNQDDLETFFNSSMKYIMELDILNVSEDDNSYSEENIDYEGWAIDKSDLVRVNKNGEPMTYNYKMRSIVPSNLATRGINGTRYLEEGSVLTLTEDQHNNVLNEYSVSFDDGYSIRAEDLVLITTDTNIDTEDDGATWSDTRTTTYTLAEHLGEQLRSRYAFLDRPTDGLSNIIMDTYLPRYLYKHKMNTEIFDLESIPSTAVSISPLTAKILGTKQIELEQMTKILGYQRKDIKKLMLAVKTRDLNFVFVGAGGTGINTAHWLSEMARMVNINHLFKRVYVYEADNTEISNLLRFPIDPSTIEGNSAKMNIIKKYVKHLSKLDPEYSSYYIASGESPYYPLNVFKHYRDNIEQPLNYQTKENIILYGAPDLETRQNLSLSGSFISATHADSGCNMYLNPKQDLSLQVESYGMIQLAPFFMNQLRMAIELLIILSDTELDLNEQDKELFKYSFDGERLMTTDRQYNFQIAEQVDMLTEEESANF